MIGETRNVVRELGGKKVEMVKKGDRFRKKDLERKRNYLVFLVFGFCFAVFLIFVFRLVAASRPRPCLPRVPRSATGIGVPAVAGIGRLLYEDKLRVGSFNA